MADRTALQDTVILRVDAKLHATANMLVNDGTDAGSFIKDELTSHLSTTVEYRIVNQSKESLQLEMISRKNQLTTDGKGAATTLLEGVNVGDSEWTYSADTECRAPISDLVEIENAPPYNVRIGVSNFFQDCPGKVIATEKVATGWDAAANVPTYESISTNNDGGLVYVTLAIGSLFASTEDWQRAAENKKSQLAEKLQATYTPHKDGGFFVSGNSSHSYQGGKDRIKIAGSLDISWNVQKGEGSGEDVEVFVEPAKDYENWIPKGNEDNAKNPGPDPLELTVTVHKIGNSKEIRKAFLSISLPYVSKNPGVSGNWPKNTGEEEGLRFLESDFPKEKGLLYKDRTHLETDSLVEEATFRVYGFDFGAWGTLRVTARDEKGRELKVRVRGRDVSDLDIPMDEDANRIADSWEKKIATGKPLDWDEEQVQGQDERGDGITLYDEYRGIMVLNEKGQRRHTRLNPAAKEMFVIDSSGAFPLEKWGKISGIQAYRLNDSLVDPRGNPGPGESPLVNLNALDKAPHPFYALKIVVRKDDPKDNDSPAFAESFKPWSIKNALAVNIFPARFLLRIEKDFEWLDKAIQQPDSAEGQELLNEGPDAEITPADAKAAWERLVSPDLRRSIAEKLQKAVFLHEVGHICSLGDHSGEAPADQKDIARSCLMFTQGKWGRRRTLVHTALGRGDGDFAYPYRYFCKGVHAPGFHCYQSLKIKDW